MKNFPYLLIAIIGIIIVVLLFVTQNRNNHCSQLADPGYCEALIAKYYFDWNDGACKRFFWGGCGGSVPFDTLEECQKMCE